MLEENNCGGSTHCSLCPPSRGESSNCRAQMHRSGPTKRVSFLFWVFFFNFRRVCELPVLGMQERSRTYGWHPKSAHSSEGMLPFAYAQQAGDRHAIPLI